MDHDDIWDDDESLDKAQQTSNESFNRDLDKLEEKHFNVCRALLSINHFRKDTSLVS